MTLTVTNLAGGYRSDITVFSGISFEIASGAVGFVGRNGAGKSCLAQTLSGALPAVAGSIALDGTDITGLRSAARVRRGLSLVPEGRKVFGQMTVHENLAVARNVARGRPGLPEFEEIEHYFPILERKRHRLAASLSGGEQQLLAIGRALMQAPDVVILDEPSLGLSPVAIDGLTDSLATIVAERRLLLVLMEQNPELLAGLCHAVHLVDQGEVARSLDMTLAEDRAALGQAYLGA